MGPARHGGHGPQPVSSSNDKTLERCSKGHTKRTGIGADQKSASGLVSCEERGRDEVFELDHHDGHNRE